MRISPINQDIDLRSAVLHSVESANALLGTGEVKRIHGSRGIAFYAASADDASRVAAFLRDQFERYVGRGVWIYTVGTKVFIDIVEHCLFSVHPASDQG